MIETEHRLTVLEVNHESLAEGHKDLKQRVTKIEDGRLSSLMEPRDWIMAAAGVATILAALLGRIPWSNVLELLGKH